MTTTNDMTTFYSQNYQELDEADRGKQKSKSEVVSHLAEEIARIIKYKAGACLDVDQYYYSGFLQALIALNNRMRVRNVDEIVDYLDAEILRMMVAEAAARNGSADHDAYDAGYQLALTENQGWILTGHSDSDIPILPRHFRKFIQAAVSTAEL